MISPKIFINGRRISCDDSPYIVSELSANHNGSLARAKQIILSSKNAGASAVKLQTYTPDTITLNCESDDFLIKEGKWAGRYLYDLYSEAFTPWEWHQSLFDYAKKIDITIFSSPFDNTAVDLLEDLNAPAYKIASFESIDIPLIKYVAQTGKPMIISTGMANAEEIQEAIEGAREGGCKELAILHCVSSYPALPSDYNLKTLFDMQKKFNLVTGLSDHTINNITALTSVALGASIIEKHVTLNRKSGGTDDSFSLEPEDLRELCEGAKTAWDALGKVDYGVKSSEQSNIKFRRSLYFVKDMQKGEIILQHHIRSIRPGFGIAPKFIDKIIGKKVNQNIISGTMTSYSLLEER